ncbi:hypothetical protein [Streptomyces reniochalinae]|uniref:hypothetical protein n=1 Tax=Streptomyces reniochalinae TaxID=2250578 RepID=UPI0015F09399|nr:hypothetical protein [Streptomyces reniochalinae]
MVTEDVHWAIAIAEALTGTAPGERLFAKASNNSGRRYTALSSWANGEYGQRLGLEPIPDGPVNPRALRRTLAMAIAQRPHGLMAVKLHLKHVSVATAEGYAARPGGHQAAFAAEVAAEEEAEHLRLTVAAYEDYQRGVLPSGQGARDLIGAFKTVDQALERHDAGPVTVIDDRRVERVLKAKAKTLRLGVGNSCWFFDPGKALCLKLAGTPDADEPLMGMCDSARCPHKPPTTLSTGRSGPTTPTTPRPSSSATPDSPNLNGPEPRPRSTVPLASSPISTLLATLTRSRAHDAQPPSGTRGQDSERDAATPHWPRSRRAEVRRQELVHPRRSTAGDALPHLSTPQGRVRPSAPSRPGSRTAARPTPGPDRTSQSRGCHSARAPEQEEH